MKKVILFTALSTLMFACGGDKSSSESKDTAKQATQQAPQTATTETVKQQPAAEPAPVKDAAQQQAQPVQPMVPPKAASSDSQQPKQPVQPVQPQKPVMPTPPTGQNEEPTSQKPAFDKQAEVNKAKKITKAFAGALKGELQKAVAAGGPVNALNVCNEKAIPITDQVAKEQGAQIKRVSLKNRNPDNVPNEWQAKVLQEFDKRAANGEDLAKMAHVEVMEKDGKKQLHFMKAMPTGKLCLACHGSELSDNVAAKVKELYPEDKATGYSENQVRGAIVVVTDIN